LLAKLLGNIRIVPDGTEIYAELDTGAERLLLAAGVALPGLVAGTRTVTGKRIRLR